MLLDLEKHGSKMVKKSMNLTDGGIFTYSMEKEKDFLVYSKTYNLAMLSLMEQTPLMPLSCSN